MRFRARQARQSVCQALTERQIEEGAAKGRSTAGTAFAAGGAGRRAVGMRCRHSKTGCTWSLSTGSSRRPLDCAGVPEAGQSGGVHRLVMLAGG